MDKDYVEGNKLNQQVEPKDNTINEALKKLVDNINNKPAKVEPLNPWNDPYKPLPWVAPSRPYRTPPPYMTWCGRTNGVDYYTGESFSEGEINAITRNDN
jgi:hypothetical protein